MRRCLVAADAGQRAAVAGTGARAHLDEDQRAVALAQDQVDFGAARMRAERDPIIALHEHEALALQIGQRARLGIVPDRLRAAPFALPPARPAALNIDPALLQRAAAEAAGAQQYPAGALYVVATPIGNLADLTLRAIHVLGLVDALACEDTRVSAGLLRHLGLDKPLIALHQHNETQAAALVLQRLAQGQRVAYVSDAGTPAVSDPGAALVAQVAAAGHRVLPIPGASSALAALSVAGDARSSGFDFIGFLPARGAERAAALRAPGAGCGGAAAVRGAAPHRDAGRRAGRRWRRSGR